MMKTTLSSDTVFELTDAAPELERQLRQLDLVFALDATGSMQPHIDDVGARLGLLVSQLEASSAGPKMATAVVAYRDHPPQDSSFVTHRCPLGPPADAIEFLRGCVAGGGGDIPEAVIDGLADAINGTEWRQRSLRIVVLVGDAPPHGVGGLLDGFPEGCPCGRTIGDIGPLAQSHRVRVFAVAIGGVLKLRPSFRAVAHSTGGKYLTLGQLESVTDRILSLLNAETDALDEEILLLTQFAQGRTLAEATRALGLDVAVVGAAVERLISKGVMRARVTPQVIAEASEPAARPWWQTHVDGTGPAAPPTSDSPGQARPTHERPWWRG